MRFPSKENTYLLPSKTTKFLDTPDSDYINDTHFEERSQPFQRPQSSARLSADERTLRRTLFTVFEENIRLHYDYLRQHSLWDDVIQDHFDVLSGQPAAYIVFLIRNKKLNVVERG